MGGVKIVAWRGKDFATGRGLPAWGFVCMFLGKLGGKARQGIVKSE